MLITSFSCADGGSGVASCQARLADGTPIANGARLPTATAGAQHVEVTATDVAGNTTATSIGYEVIPAPAPPASAAELLRAQVALVHSFQLGLLRSVGLLAPLTLTQFGVAFGLRPLACQSLAAFDRTVDTYLARRWLTATQATRLRSGSTAIRSAIPC